MKMVRTVRNRVLATAFFAAILVSVPKPAHAASKEIIQLQTQVQQLLDMVQRLQSTMDTRFGVLQNLAQETADQAKQMGITVNDLQKKINAENEGVNGKVDTVSGQVQSLNDSVDELKSRMAKLTKSIEDMQAQMQNVQAQPAPGAGGANLTTAPGGQPAGAPAVNQTPPLQETFQSGLRDFNAGNYQVAAGEFQDVLHYYPLDDLAGSAQFYMGEIAYQQKRYDDSISAYNNVLEGFSGNAKAPAAQLHKGLALLAQNKRDAGIHELRALIQRHPRTPEAASARSKLNGMGVKITATK
jgi:TolA-binding protein